MNYANILNLVHLAQASTSGASPAANGGAGGGSTMIVMMLCFGVIFYFLLIRPQNQKLKQQQALINAMKTGDKVITSGGIHGMISNVKESTIIVKIADNVKIEVDKAAITTVIKRSEGETEAAA